MALEGSLREFNVADILQLIFFQKKAGVLLLVSRNDRVRILFNEGNIVGADSRKRSFEKKLGTILVKKGLITDEQVDKTLDKQRAEGGKFGAVLVREGFVSKEQLQEVITFQITEVMVQVFSMKEGHYEFKPQSVPVDKDIGVVLNTEHFLMEGVRLVDEWSEIEGKIHIDDLYEVVHSTLPPDSEDTDKKVFALVDGINTVADITDISGIDSFTVSSSILKLSEAGVLKKHVEEKAVEDAPKAAMKPIPGLHAFIYLLLLATIATSFLIMGKHKNNDYLAFKASEQLDALRLDIETGYYLNGAYPESISAVDPWGHDFLYEVNSNGILIMSAGPDGYLDTQDDIPPVYSYFADSPAVVEESPEDVAPAEDAPAQETPAEESPAEESPDQE